MEKDTEAVARWCRSSSNLDSQIDVRLHQILGQFMNQFKSGQHLSARNLGPMFGQWGSFLPAKLRPPSVLVLEKASHADPLEPPCQLVQGKDVHNTVDECAKPVSRPSLEMKQNTSHRPPLAPNHGNITKPNPENILDCTKPDPDLKSNLENLSACENQLKCAVNFWERKREDKGVGPSPKKRNMRNYSFSHSRACVKPETRDGEKVRPHTFDPKEKHAMDITPCTPIDNKEQRVQFLTDNNNLTHQEVQAQLKQATTIHKEAQDLEQRASRLKKTGQDRLSAELYMEAALKYLHTAYILEPTNWDKIKPGDADKSVKLYVHAGKLFKEVAPIFQDWMHLVPAGLAYKCMEVAFMKACFYKNIDISKDCHKLQIDLQNQPPVELLSVLDSSPSNIPLSWYRLLDYVNVMNSAFEGTRGYEGAFKDAANGAKDSCLFKDALNLDFQNMELVLQTVRRALASSPC